MELREELFAGGAPEYEEFRGAVARQQGQSAWRRCRRGCARSATPPPVDGSYGSRTSEAVKLFQKEAGLRQTGGASVATMKALMDPDAPECSSYIPREGRHGDNVEKLQARLNALGYYAGDASGSFDDRTAAAVKRSRTPSG